MAGNDVKLRTEEVPKGEDHEKGQVHELVHSVKDVQMAYPSPNRSWMAQLGRA
jgi:hypothetical protein